VGSGVSPLWTEQLDRIECLLTLGAELKVPTKRCRQGLQPLTPFGRFTGQCVVVTGWSGSWTDMINPSGQSLELKWVAIDLRSQDCANYSILVLLTSVMDMWYILLDQLWSVDNLATDRLDIDEAMH